MMEQEGFEKRDFTDRADVYVINTCSVTDNADKECRMLVRRIQRKAPESLVVITGCYAQLKPKEIAEIPGVDLVLGAAEKFNLGKHITDLSKGDNTKISSCDIEEVNGFISSWSQGDRTRTFLKVQDGCDYTCSFCTIPMARGKSRSDSINNVVKNVQQLANEGVKEIVLTGVNLGDFRAQTAPTLTRPHLGEGTGTIENIALGTEQVGDEKSSGKEGNFLDLIRELDKIAGIDRYRISSIEPNLLTDEIIEFVANSRAFMPHFHIPLQSGSNKILGLMRRRYKRELYAEKVAKIKSLMPHCAIGVDVIVGFPGETDADFKETFDFLHSLEVSYLHVFTYSERDNTKALEIKPVVPVLVRNERNKALRNLSYMKLQFFTKQHEGENRPVLFEGHNKDGMMEGYTDNYIRIQTPFRGEWANRIVAWKV